MEKFIYINDISIQDNKIYLDSKHKIEKIKINNESFSIFCNLKNNIIDLAELILENKITLFEERSYKLFEVNGLEERLICMSQDTLNNSKYMAKSFKISIEGCIYFINIYIYEGSDIEITIKKEEAYNIDFEALYVSNEKMILDISCGVIEDIEETKVILVGNSSDEIFEFAYDKIENGKVRFNIDLMTLLNDKNYKLTTLIEVDGKIYYLKAPKDVSFKGIKLEKDNLLKFVSAIVDTDNKLFVSVDNNITVKPIITSVEYNDNLIVKGIINSSISLTSSKLISCNIRISGNDGKTYICYPVNVENDLFTLVLDSRKISDLKESYQGEWDTAFEVLINGKLNVEAPLFSKDKCDLESVKKVLYSDDLLINGENILSEFIVPENSDNIKFNIRNKIIIEKVVFVKVKNDRLIVKFKAKENIEKLLRSNQLNVDMVVNGIKLKQQKISKIEKKTFMVHYMSDNTKNIAEDMYKKGVEAVINYNNRISISKISDVDKDNIFYSFYQRVQYSNKYKKIVRSIYKKLLVKLPIKKNWIVYESFLGRNMSDSPKYIYQYLQNEYKGKYKHIWVFNQKRDDLPKNIKQVKRFSFEHLYYIARSKFWINNMRQPTWFIKRQKQVFLATWHGTPLKKLVFDIEEIHSANKNYKEEFYIQSRVWDYLISANKYSTEIFRRAFKFDNEILELGYPRNDLLYTENKEKFSKNLKKELGIPLDKKIVLYAPTWRDDEVLKPGKYKFELELDLQRLRKELGDQYFFILRTHYFIANHIDVEGLEDFVYNASKYDDITDLYLLSDVLITDYSSVFFDYANLKRPTLFFTYDLEKYRDVLRGFYLDLESEGPGPIVMTNDDIIRELKDFNLLLEKYKDKIDRFHERFCTWDDGKAAERVAEEVVINNNKF